MLVTTLLNHAINYVVESELIMAHLGAAADRQGVAVDHPGACNTLFFWK
jgi:hypothetical protein